MKKESLVLFALQIMHGVKNAKKKPHFITNASKHLLFNEGCDTEDAMIKLLEKEKETA